MKVVGSSTESTVNISAAAANFPSASIGRLIIGQNSKLRILQKKNSRPLRVF